MFALTFTFLICVAGISQAKDLNEGALLECSTEVLKLRAEIKDIIKEKDEICNTNTEQLILEWEEDVENHKEKLAECKKKGKCPEVSVEGEECVSKVKEARRECARNVSITSGSCTLQKEIQQREINRLSAELKAEKKVRLEEITAFQQAKSRMDSQIDKLLNQNIDLSMLVETLAPSTAAPTVAVPTTTETPAIDPYCKEYMQPSSKPVSAPAGAITLVSDNVQYVITKTVKDIVTLEEARTRCRHLGMWVLTLKSSEQLTNLLNKISATTRYGFFSMAYWLDAKRDGMTTDFKWKCENSMIPKLWSFYNDLREQHMHCASVKFGLIKVAHKTSFRNNILCDSRAFYICQKPLN